MNSLIQTCYYTPGFCERLFALSWLLWAVQSPSPSFSISLSHSPHLPLLAQQQARDDLCVPANGDLTAPTVRRVPLQLQRLFARLRLLDQSAVSTEELTKSFGWTGREAVCLA